MPTWAICPAMRQMSPKGSRYREELTSFWKVSNTAVRRLISNAADSSLRKPMAIPNTIEKKTMAIVLPLERAENIFEGTMLEKKVAMLDFF